MARWARIFLQLAATNEIARIHRPALPFSCYYIIHFNRHTIMADIDLLRDFIFDGYSSRRPAPVLARPENTGGEYTASPPATHTEGSPPASASSTQPDQPLQASSGSGGFL